MQHDTWRNAQSIWLMAASIAVTVLAALILTALVVPSKRLTQESTLSALTDSCVLAPCADTLVWGPGNRAAETRHVDLGEGVMLEMVWCPAGEYMRGEDKVPYEVMRLGADCGYAYLPDNLQHKVKLTQGFWLGKFEVTQAQWLAVMGSNPSHFKEDKGRQAAQISWNSLSYSLDFPVYLVCGNLPVEQVSWNDCQEFLRTLNAKVSARHFRLPTEAEWEYACRAGTTTTFHFGAMLSRIQANFNESYIYGREHRQSPRQRTTPVGSFPANAWGLHDMHGNVMEWCQDWYQWYDEYPGGVVTDPVGPPSGSSRVLRGGSWYRPPRDCRSAGRHYYAPTDSNFDVGFRIALSPTP